MNFFTIIENHLSPHPKVRIKLVNADGSNQLYHNTNALLRTISEAKHVSIVQYAAAYLGNKAVSPNPINIKVGDTITWTNDDIETHTVTLDFGFNDSDFGKGFDYGIIGYKQTFSHKFTTGSELDYSANSIPRWLASYRYTVEAVQQKSKLKKK